MYKKLKSISLGARCTLSILSLRLSEDLAMDLDEFVVGFFRLTIGILFWMRNFFAKRMASISRLADADEEVSDVADD